MATYEPNKTRYCSVCGFMEHRAIHQPPLNAPEGSAPYGHKYQPANKAMNQKVAAQSAQEGNV